MRRLTLGGALLFVAMVVGCGDDVVAPIDAGGDGFVPTACASDTECDDGLFCNGPERCAPGTPEADAIGCAQGTAPCVAGQRCMEAAEECASNCSVVPDADGDGADGIDCGGTDCDDTDASRYPGATELCDAANVDEDCNPTTYGTRDGDGDGFIDVMCCNAGEAGGAMHCGDDCSDFRRDMHPGFAETCDFLDNDCDGAIDEGAAVTGFADLDHDLHGDPSAPLTACPDTPGFSVLDDDCNDADPEVHSAQLEICDGKDNNCNGTVDEAPAAVTWYADDDDDGFGIDGSRTRVSCEPIPGFSLRPSDCDDMRRDRNPAARELCNGEDDDCDGVADFMIRPGNLEDDDGDGFADMICGGNDCDDSNGAIHPGAFELCDLLDNDCDGIADGGSAMGQWYLDLDGDGFGDPSMPAIESCEPQPSRVSRGDDCDDASAAIHPGVTDPCDAIDNDCDGATDEDSTRLAYYSDVDGDGWGVSASAIVFACIPPAGRSTRPGDCEDSRATTYPGAPELCDLFDNDCDTMVDEDAPISWYPDVDRDGHGVPGGAIVTCSPPAGYAMVMDDCDDGNGGRYPGHAEDCDLVDNDCDGTVDDGASAACIVAGGVGACTTGTCTVASCSTGFANCDGLFASGCEVDTRVNPRHCGGCGMACQLGDTCGRVTASMCDGSRFDVLRSGDTHVFALRSTGTLLGWGSSSQGQVGTGTTTNVPVATPVMTDVIAVYGGASHSCAVTSSRQVWCWGYNNVSQLADGTIVNRASPVLVAGVSGAAQVAAGSQHTCVLRTDGRVMCWGYRRNGALGDGIFASTTQPVPTLVPGIDDAVEIVSGIEHVCVRRPLGGGGYRVQCWGANVYGQLGDGTTTARATPGDVVGLPSDIVGFGYGSSHRTCVRLSSGEARCFGHNGFGGLASGAPDRDLAATSPVTMTLAPAGGPATGIRQICTGEFMSCVLRDRGVPGVGEVLCAGADDFGQMGDGVVARADASRLQAVIDPSGVGTFDDAIAITCSRNQACAARADGSIWCWGNDGVESLGNGPGTFPSTNPTPLRVVGP